MREAVERGILPSRVRPLRQAGEGCGIIFAGIFRKVPMKSSTGPLIAHWFYLKMAFLWQGHPNRSRLNTKKI